MKLTNKQPITDDDAEPRSHVVRRRFLGVVGGGGLATACTVFGFASPAYAVGPVSFKCCTLCCKPTWTLAYCESVSHYVWQCTNSDGTTCECCEHGAPCLKANGCVGKAHFSSAKCT